MVVIAAPEATRRSLPSQSRTMNGARGVPGIPGHAPSRWSSALLACDDPALVGEFGDVHGPAAGEPVGRADGDPQVPFGQLLDGQRRIALVGRVKRRHAGEQREIERSCPQRADECGAGALAQRDVDADDQFQGRRDDAGEGAREGAEPDRAEAAAVRVVVEIALDRAQGVERGCGVPEYDLACGRETHSCPLAREHPAPDGGLQHTHALGNRRLRVTELARCRGERAALRDRAQDREIDRREVEHASLECYPVVIVV